mmetsp:Transcript_29269/g.88032  ORF Transcript_29269/g.88032 Transcript_29269/m.88032 type:complete len:225 (+) Transcript_29269:40-714(+)
MHLARALVAMAAAAVAAAATYELEVQHAYGHAAPFAARGALEVAPGAPKHKMLKASPAEVELDASALAALLAADGLYRVRLRRAGGTWVGGSIRACDLAAAELKEELGVTLNARGDPIALAFKAARGVGACPTPEEATLATTAAPVLDVVAQIIPVQAKVAKPPGGMGTPLPRGGGGGSSQDNPHAEPQKPKSFLMKYWHILLPLALLLLTTSEPEPPKKEKAS